MTRAVPPEKVTTIACERRIRTGALTRKEGGTPYLSSLSSPEPVGGAPKNGLDPPVGGAPKNGLDPPIGGAPKNGLDPPIGGAPKNGLAAIGGGAYGPIGQYVGAAGTEPVKGISMKQPNCASRFHQHTGGPDLCQRRL